MEYSYSDTFFRDSYLNLNRTKYFVLREFEIDLDLTEVFSLKKSSTCSPDLIPIEHIREYKYY